MYRWLLRFITWVCQGKEKNDRQTEQTVDVSELVQVRGEFDDYTKNWARHDHEKEGRRMNSSDVIIVVFYLKY